MQKYFYLLCFCLCCCLPMRGVAQDKNELRKQADAFFQQKKYQNALNLYQDLISADENDMKSIYKAGICCLELRIIENSVEYLEIIKETRDSTLKDFNFWYAKASYYNQNFDTALYYLQRTSLTYGEDAKTLLDNIRQAIDLQKQSKNYVIENLGNVINGAEADFAPILSKDRKRLIFTRNKHTNKLHEDGKNIKEYEIVETSIKNDYSWSKPKPLSGLGDTSLIAIQLAEDENKMYLQHKDDIYLSEQVGGLWKNPVYVEGFVNDGQASEINCFVYHYGQKMILVSNKNTKNKNFDLFESSLRRDGTWAMPTPITSLNSLQDEISPFVAEDGKTLYFSSKGHQNIGGYDIFRSVFDEQTQTWGKPENMGMPINSVNDDYYFSLYEDIGYFASQRMGGKGKDDLYKVYLFAEVKVTGKVFNRISNQVMPNCKIRFITETKIVETNGDEHGAYEILLPFEENIQVKVFLGEKVVYEEQLYIHIPHKKTRNINRNYYVDLTKNIDNSTIPQEIHIFGIVSDAKTGQRFIQPIQLIDSLGTEIKATSTDQNGHYNIYCTLKDERYAIFLHKKGYLMTFKEVNLEQIIKQKLELNIELQRIELGAKFILRNIFFHSGSDVLASTSFAELNKLYFFLKENPETKIEIAGHTDNIGNADNNLKLSENRAKSVFIYLTNKGIKNNRMVFKGYGDTQAIASNDDEKDGRELNRRIEIKILPMN